MSEAQELVEELKERFDAWRLRTRREPDLLPPEVEAGDGDVSDIEFTPLDPFAPLPSGTPRIFADLTPAWIAAHCAPHVFARAQQHLTRKQVTRVHAHGGRMTGTTCERHYDDQELTLQNGQITASCTCLNRAPISLPAVAAPVSAVTTQAVSSLPDTEAPAHLLACSHVVAVLLAYLQTSSLAVAERAETRPAAPDRLVCPVTRQTLQANKPWFQCERCGLAYSPEGWQFLRQTAKGHCCNCDARNAVKEVVSSQ